VKLTFGGTREEIDACTRRHRRHSLFQVSYCDRRVMVDAGEDWKDEALTGHAPVRTLRHAAGLRAW